MTSGADIRECRHCGDGIAKGAVEENGKLYHVACYDVVVDRRNSPEYQRFLAAMNGKP